MRLFTIEIEVGAVGCANVMREYMKSEVVGKSPS